MGEQDKQLGLAQGEACQPATPEYTLDTALVEIENLSALLNEQKKLNRKLRQELDERFVRENHREGLCQYLQKELDAHRAFFVSVCLDPILCKPVFSLHDEAMTRVANAMTLTTNSLLPRPKQNRQARS